MKASALAFLVLVACSTPEPAPEQFKPLATHIREATACPVMSAECKYIQVHPWKESQQMQLNRLLYSCVAFLVSCQNPTPPPNPPPPNAGGSTSIGGTSSIPVQTGGTVATGGALGTGGAKATGGTSGLSPLAKCTAKLTASSSVKNVAAQSGVTVAQLVKTMCSDATILGGFN